MKVICEICISVAIGAGDTFIAGAILGMGLKGWDVIRSARFACALATTKCAQVGFERVVERVDLKGWEN